MEGMLNFVSIIIIVFGILQIILFFKIWGMTNNVSNIKFKLWETTNETKEYEWALIRGDYNKAYDILLKKISIDIHNAYYSFNAVTAKKEIKRIITLYKPKFQNIHKEIPRIF